MLGFFETRESFADLLPYCNAVGADSGRQQYSENIWKILNEYWSGGGPAGGMTTGSGSCDQPGDAIEQGQGLHSGF
jgi:hypothetical protein